MALFFDYLPSIEGFDTESYKGDLKLICSSKGCYEPNSKEDLIEWLFKNAEDLNFFYNISFDFSIIIKKYIDPDNKEAIRKGKGIEIGNYIVDYIEGKYFGIQDKRTHRKGKKKFYDIAQFYKGGDNRFRGLDSVAKQELGIGKSDKELEIDRRLIGELEGYYEKNRESIIKYCKHDALLTKRLAEKRVKTVYEILGAIPKNWYSNASISKAYLKLYHPKELYAYPKLIETLPKPIRYLAFETIRNSYYGGLFYDAEFGNLGLVSELDINSSYPDAIRKLKSIVGAKIERTEIYEPTADYSFYKIKMKYPKDFPFPYRLEHYGQTAIIYPESLEYVETYTTGIEIEYLREKNVDFEVLDGFAIYCKDAEAEFQDFEDLYQKRLEYKREGNDTLQYMLKIIYNSAYGCFAESKTGFKELTDFVYASYITAMTRLKIYRKCDEIGWDKVKVIKTDAIIYSGDYRYNSEKLGDFKQEFENKEFINYFSGLSIIDGNLQAKRGFTSIRADDLLNAKGDTLKVDEKARPVKLKEGIIQDRIDEIGDFKVKSKELHLHSNLRKYEIDPAKLKFEYLKDNPVKTMPLIVRDNASRKKENREGFYRLMMIARQQTDRKPPKAPRELKAKNEDRLLKRLEELKDPKTFRERERLKRFLKSKKWQKYMETHMENKEINVKNIVKTYVNINVRML